MNFEKISVMRDLYITTSLSRKKEIFKPINEGHVGLYVCGPTVYGDAHLGHARPGVTYDVFVKLLKHLGYKVRYVRNITDVGHLEHDADEGEDKIAKKARLEQLEPMDVVQRCTLAYHEAMRMLNVAPPSIDPVHQDTSSSRSTSSRRSSTPDMPTRATDRYISMSSSMIRTIATASFRGAPSMK